MNKTTIKISVLAFLGFMTYGYAQQQQQDPHRGKVGINTVTPSATMDVQPNSDNARAEAKTNEGIIAPKLSKTRIANIATPVEGTLVYATDETTSPISAYTGGDTKVAKITEKGYYYYNGTEWVKAGNNSLAVDGSKWTNDTANNTVKLANLSDGVTIRENMKNMIITDLGEVGIGVYNNGNLGKLGVRNSLKLPNVPVVSIGTLINTNNNVSQGLMFYTDNIDFPARIDVVRGGSSQETGLAFLSSNKAIPIEQMRITPTGNIGIGTTTPTEKLDVAGSIKSTALAGSGNRPVYADAEGKLVIGSSTTIRSAWVPDTASNSVQLAITSANGDRTTHPISITDEGMVRATSFQGVNGATIFPDYVFQKYYTGTSSIKADYNFKSLSQVEDFVKANGHLPGYKSAETIKAQGYVDLMETQLTNVEKIEELYLHSIEQDKVNKQQAEALRAKDAEIADLKQRLERLEKLIQ
ncbi:hypothetical protein [Bergeyella zoohelcum]|uniref:Uncharacterized protein n=1 Tax=Bergeyella zoohelcum TaxID=1015 RepID=A0A7Z8YNQ7_9FLAO|nr:hypothetical protein [Bergeyella zoohelcum]VDH04518.1 Uncharacterised protein [Bergeyella zoohelcum]